MPTYIGDLVSNIIVLPIEAEFKEKELPKEIVKNPIVKNEKKIKPSKEEEKAEEKELIIEEKSPIKDKQEGKKKLLKEELMLKKYEFFLSFGGGYSGIYRNKEEKYYYYDHVEGYGYWEPSGTNWNAEIGLGYIINRNFQISFCYNYLEGRSYLEYDYIQYFSGWPELNNNYSYNKLIRLTNFFLKIYICNDWYSKKSSYYAFSGFRISFKSSVPRWMDDIINTKSYIDNNFGAILGAGLNISYFFIEASLYFPAPISNLALSIDGGIRFRF